MMHHNSYCSILIAVNEVCGGIFYILVHIIIFLRRWFYDIMWVVLSFFILKSFHILEKFHILVFYRDLYRIKY